jgi:uncharacterized membrane protein YfcA
MTFEIAGLSLPAVLVCSALAVIGSSIQGTLGFGLGMMTSPLLAMVDPSFVPSALMISVLPLTFGVAWRDRTYIDLSGFKWALLGRFPGVFIGLVALASMSGDSLAFAVSGSVAIAVVISVITSRRGQVVPLTWATLSGAGFASGFMGTVTSIGGPPMALVYKDGDPRVMRATIAGFFSIGAVISVIGLVLSGEVGQHELALTAVILPGVLAGLPISRRIGPYLPARRMRPLILVICSASAVILAVRTAFF